MTGTASPRERGASKRPSPSQSGVSLQDLLGPATTAAGERIAALTHVSANQGRRLALFARLNSVSLILRPVNDEAPDLRTQGHPPKPIQIKYKTLNPIDAEIGAPKDKRAEGRVALFLPIQLKHPSAPVKDRYEQRLQEWLDANDRTQGESELERLVREKRAAISRSEDGMVFVAKQGGFVMSPRHGRSYTGDLDLFAILDKDDRRTSPELNTSLVAHDPRSGNRRDARGACRLGYPPGPTLYRDRRAHPREAPGTHRAA